MRPKYLICFDVVCIISKPEQHFCWNVKEAVYVCIWQDCIMQMSVYNLLLLVTMTIGPTWPTEFTFVNWANGTRACLLGLATSAVLVPYIKPDRCVWEIKKSLNIMHLISVQLIMNIKTYPYTCRSMTPGVAGCKKNANNNYKERRCCSAGLWMDSRKEHLSLSLQSIKNRSCTITTTTHHTMLCQTELKLSSITCRAHPSPTQQTASHRE